MKLRCGHESAVWKEEPPSSSNRYRVECPYCMKWDKWGTERELATLTAQGADVTVVPYKEPPPPPTLDAFFVD
jgi:hypothetical protein